MSESGSSSDKGSPSSSFRFELAMLESSRPLLKSCTKETLDDLHNCQTLVNIGSSSFMSVGERVVCDDIPIFRFEFTVIHLEKNLLDNEKQLEALRQSCSIPRIVGMRLVHHEELPSEPPKGHMLSFIGYALGQLNPGFWDTLIGFYIIWMKCGLGEPFLHQLRYCYKMRSVKACTGYAECACRSERERIVFVEKVIKKGGISTKKGKAPMLVPVDDILFHKGACKHRVRPTPRPKSQEEVLKITASKKAEAEAIGYAAAIVAGEEKRLFRVSVLFSLEEGVEDPTCKRARPGLVPVRYLGLTFSLQLVYFLKELKDKGVLNGAMYYWSFLM
ncbi:hypothetical protein D8674_005549 [Pyrus ussuriensis x Pyrus communis]|uniref:Uncharacterized protein n=1 Tax=Pyrus ussuriensis x Pyrus communis TaxID=2448454 RepID=A0A5N5FXG3_9ROSA|nr:hypothetical protein D8674_005549 [Pyrus ussuriensis x Pyrus communis]